MSRTDIELLRRQEALDELRETIDSLLAQRHELIPRPLREAHFEELQQLQVLLEEEQRELDALCDRAARPSDSRRGLDASGV